MIEAAVAMFLNPYEHLRTQDIAAELGISTKTLKKITQDETFIELYNDHFLEVSHDPRIQLVRSSIGEIAPLALQRLTEMVEKETTPPTVLLNAIKLIFEKAGIEPVNVRSSDKKELVDFLNDRGVNIQQMNVNIHAPSEYEEVYAEVLEGVVREPASLLAPTEKDAAVSVTQSDDPLQ